MTTLKIEGMSCQHCVQAVAAALGRLSGVAAAQVDLETGLARVEYDEGKAAVSEMLQAIAEEGYAAQETF